VTDGILEGTSRKPSFSIFLEAGFVTAAVRPVAPCMDKDYEARSAALTVLFGERRAVGVSNERFMAVLLEPRRTFEDALERFEILDHLEVHFWGFWGRRHGERCGKRRRDGERSLLSSFAGTIRIGLDWIAAICGGELSRARVPPLMGTRGPRTLTHLQKELCQHPPLGHLYARQCSLMQPMAISMCARRLRLRLRLNSMES